MKSNELVSVIVPIYNVEKYLKKCLDSIIKQTYTNLEIILIDDGSSDRCGEICDIYAQKDSRILVIHKENGGVSEARNKGIDRSIGRYIVFVDADDYIEEDMIEKLYCAVLKYDADIACCAQFIETKKKRKIQNNGSEFCENGEQILGRMLLFDQIDTGPCAKIYGSHLFASIRYPIKRRYEDMGTIYKLFAASEKIVHISYVGYHYVMHNESFMHKKFHSEHFDSLYFSKEIHEFICKKYPALAKKSESYYFLAITSILQKIKGSDNFVEYKKEYKEIKKIFHKNMRTILKNHYIPTIKKIMIVCIYFNQYWIITAMKRMLGKEW